ncbi:MAG: hypothetical protein QOD38_478 [Acidimicrobiaceae bacterium]
MSVIEPHDSDDGWAGRVAFASGPEPFAYVPGEVVVGGRRGRDIASELFGSRLDDIEPVFPSREEGAGQFFVMRTNEELDAITVVHDLRLEGVVAQPNHVLFAHGDCCCGVHPADRGQGCVGASPVYASPVYASPVYASPVYASPVYASPVYASPVYASPVYASPVYASPVYASPVYASDLQATGKHHSSARPAAGPGAVVRTAPAGAYRPRVTVLDTGLARDGLRPQSLDGVLHQGASWQEGPDDDGDQYLDPAAGHGTFISFLIDTLCPGCDITADRVLTNYGEGNEVAIARRIDEADTDLLNLSFGGYAMEHMNVLAAAVRGAQVRGTVVVASAGNDGTCRATFPAALPGVIGVAAIGPSGPARFSNYGPWVRACAPGVDMVSGFFTVFDGAGPAPAGGTDPDNFAGWARWSGTSFSAPVVVAALARELQHGLTSAQAVSRVIDAPGLLRLADMGTVVNLA